MVRVWRPLSPLDRGMLFKQISDERSYWVMTEVRRKITNANLIVISICRNIRKFIGLNEVARCKYFRTFFKQEKLKTYAKLG